MGKGNIYKSYKFPHVPLKISCLRFLISFHDISYVCQREKDKFIFSLDLLITLNILYRNISTKFFFCDGINGLESELPNDYSTSPPCLSVDTYAME